MFKYLQISDRRERWIVGCCDLLLGGGAALAGRGARRRALDPPRRILLLRLERIGDVLLTLGAFELVRARAPLAEVHLVVGSWNESLARLIPGVTSIETLDVPWLARRDIATGVPTLVSRARAWRGRQFDVAINFEPDVRSNVLLALGGATERVGYASGGGGALLTRALEYRPHLHSAANAEALVNAALAPPAGAAGNDTSGRLRSPRLRIPEEARERADQILATAGSVRIGLHASAGRAVKQWHLDRLAQVATRLAREYHATLVLTGAPDDRPFVDRLKACLPADVPTIDASGGSSLPELAALLERLALFITGDTGPMHLAAAVDIPIVAVFGPSDPGRYRPLASRARVVTADLWCRPCGRVRRPPQRCAGRVPDCLDHIDVQRVYDAANEVLRG